MLVASAGLAVASLFTRRWPISGNDHLDHTPSKHWQKPQLVLDIAPEQGPVMINVRYEVDAQHAQIFLQEIRALSKSRLRDGATFWQIFEDAGKPGSFVEAYVVNSWLDHLRQHERISKQDALIQTRIRALLLTGTTPVVTHFINPAANQAASANGI
jgi:hypothetical protein